MDNAKTENLMEFEADCDDIGCAVDDPDAVRTVLEKLFVSGDVFEIRVMGAVRAGNERPRNETGFFDFDHISGVISSLAGIVEASSVYVTFNPVDNQLLSRSPNRLTGARSDGCTRKEDIRRRRWLLLDIDPCRQPGVAATEHEKTHAVRKYVEVRGILAGRNWPDPLGFDSGNGIHALYRINLPGEDGGLTKRCLEALQPFGDAQVHIDLAVANANQLVRLPGTWNRKGENCPERPHRIAKILDMPANPLVVGNELLEALASAIPLPTESPKTPSANKGGSNGSGWEGGVCPNRMLRPGDDFNQRGDIKPILEKNGWQCIDETSDNQRWRRPGKTSGSHSATFNGDTFFVFTSNASPFTALTGYGKFSTYAMLEHDGNMAAAARALAEEGFGGAALEKSVDISSLVEGLSAETGEMDGGDLMDVGDGDEFDDPGALPDELLHVPGFVDEVMQFCLATAPYPNRTLAFVGAMCFLSYLVARKVADVSGNMPNLYAIALANSGVGKDHPRKVNVEIASQVNLTDGVADGFASGEGIEDAMSACNSMLFQTDEIDAICNTVKNGRDGRNEAIMQVLLKFYSSASSTYITRKKAGMRSGEGIIHKPSLTLFGTAVPNFFFNSANSRMMANGFFARMLIFEADRRGKGQTARIITVPQSIVDEAKRWAHGNGFQGGGENLCGISPQPRVVSDSKEAQIRREEIRGEIDGQHYKKAENMDDQAGMAIWCRAMEKTAKLALLYACSENPTNPEVTVAGLDWAYEIVRHLTRRTLYKANLLVADTDFEGSCNRVREILTKWRRNHNGDYMPYWELTRRLRQSTECTNRVLMALSDQRIIEIDPRCVEKARPRCRLMPGGRNGTN